MPNLIAHGCFKRIDLLHSAYFSQGMCAQSAHCNGEGQQEGSGCDPRFLHGPKIQKPLRAEAAFERNYRNRLILLEILHFLVKGFLKFLVVVVNTQTLIATESAV